MWLEKEKNKDMYNLLKKEYPENLSQILSGYSFSSLEEVKTFLKRDYWYDPSLMKNMVKVSEIIKKTDRSTRIVVFGDYDCDGCCGTSVIKKVLDSLGFTNHVILLPTRDDGYGISLVSVSKILDENPDLVITVDCGSKDVEGIQCFNDYEIPVIVFDHHEVDMNNLPNAIIINPKQKDCKYPFKELAGAGVAYKFAEMVLTDKFVLQECLQLATIATIGDVMPLVDENRSIVSKGIVAINSNPIIGLKYLIKESSSKDNKINSRTIAFQLVPKINASGRIKTPVTSLRLLLANHNAEAEFLAKRLTQLNDQRKEEEIKITNGINTDEIELNKGIVMFDPKWLVGVIGIVAGKLVEKYNKPTFLMTQKGDTVIGSCRSIDGVNIVEILEKCKNNLEKFGGHTKAAGFKLKTSNVNAFIKELNDYLNSLELSEEKISKKYDLKIDIDKIDVDLIEQIDVLEPFGEGNEEPVLLTQITKFTDVRSYPKGETLSCVLNNKIKAVGFGKSHLKEALIDNNNALLSFTPFFSNFSNKTECMIKEITF